VIEKFRNYIQDVSAEMRRVTWPGPDELRASTLLVIVATIILTVFIGVVDLLLSRVLGGLHSLL